MAMVALSKDKIKRVIVSVDWGYVNPGVMQVWALDGEDRMYLVHELYFTKQFIDWWIDKARAIQRHFRPIVFVCDPSEPAFIQQLQQAGCNAIGANNDVLPGIVLVQQRLARWHDNYPGLVILHNALEERDEALAQAHKPVCLEQEISTYVWKTAADGKPVKEEPLKVNDHACDAMRYAVVYVDMNQLSAQIVPQATKFFGSRNQERNTRGVDRRGLYGSRT